MFTNFLNSRDIRRELKVLPNSAINPDLQKRHFTRLFDVGLGVLLLWCIRPDPLKH